MSKNGLVLSKNCAYCGQRLRKDALTCPQCGKLRPEYSFGKESEAAVVSAQQPQAEESREALTYVPTPGKRKMPILPFIIAPVALLCVVAVVLFIFWQPICVKLAPEKALSVAVANTFKNLTDRMEGSPLLFVMDHLDLSKPNKTMVSMESADIYSDLKNIDITLYSDAENERLLADFTLGLRQFSMDSTYVEYMDFSAYSDRESIGVRLPDYDRKYYGIRYDSFSKDFDNSLFAEYAPELKEQLQPLVDAAKNSVDYDELLKPYLDIVKTRLQALPIETEQEEIFVGSGYEKCDVIRMSFTYSDISDLLDALLFQLERDEGMEALYNSMPRGMDDWDSLIYGLQEIRDSLDKDLRGNFEFYIHDFAVTAFCWNMQSASTPAWKLYVDFSEIANTRDLAIDLIVKNEDGETMQFNCIYSNQLSPYTYRSSLDIEYGLEGEKEALSYSLSWDNTTGMLSLSQEDTSTRICLKEEGEGIFVSFDLDDISVELKHQPHDSVEAVQIISIDKWDEPLLEHISKLFE